MFNYELLGWIISAERASEPPKDYLCYIHRRHMGDSSLSNEAVDKMLNGEFEEGVDWKKIDADEVEDFIEVKLRWGGR